MGKAGAGSGMLSDSFEQQSKESLKALHTDLLTQYERLDRASKLLGTALTAAKAHADQVQYSHSAAAMCPAGTPMVIGFANSAVGLPTTSPVRLDECIELMSSEQSVEEEEEEEDDVFPLDIAVATPGTPGDGPIKVQHAPGPDTDHHNWTRNSSRVSKNAPSETKSNAPSRTATWNSVSGSSRHGSKPPELVDRGAHPTAQELLLEAQLGPRDHNDYRTEFRARRMSHMSASLGCIDGNSWEGQLSLARRNAIFRLQARLGMKNMQGAVTSDLLHGALTALGLVKFTPQTIDHWMYGLKVACWENAIEQGSLGAGSAAIRLFPKRNRSSRKANNSSVALDYSEESRENTTIGAASGEQEGSMSIQFKAFAEALLSDDLISGLDKECQSMALTIREVLFSGVANRLVAELTHVRVDDVAAPPEKADVITKIEPLLALVTVCNGIFIGMQTGAQTSTYQQLETNFTWRASLDQWFWGNVTFTCAFLLEVVLRVRQSGMCKASDRWWNIFDIGLLTVSFGDILIDVLSASGLLSLAGSSLTSLAVLRVMRLTRLTRLLRIFRLRYMREVQLMVRGLVGGLYTLFWAVVLLFFTLYVIGVMATTTIGTSEQPPEIQADGLFSSVPEAIVTSFRCFTGDCTTSGGKPIVKLLSDSYGTAFVMCYLASTIFVVFGLFNLIVAVYIENTMNAAKTEGEKTKQERHRESVRIARLSRQLLKKFCAAQKQLFEEPTNDDFKDALKSAAFDDVGEMHQPISKEMFLCVIQDTSVQKIMDDLDIPADRAGLFDVLDSDSSGGLEVPELITGLLQVRGEAKKCDIVGALLAVRTVQDMLREQHHQIKKLEDLVKEMGQRADRFWDSKAATTPRGHRGSFPMIGEERIGTPSGEKKLFFS